MKHGSSPEARGARRGQEGFTLAEMLVAMTVMLVVMGAIFSLVDPVDGHLARAA